MAQLLYTFKQAAAMLGRDGDQGIRDLVNSGDLPAVICPGTKNDPRIRHQDLADLADAAKPYTPRRAQVD